jgi:hypothetical protein
MPCGGFVNLNFRLAGRKSQGGRMIHAYDRFVFTAIPERRGPYVASFTAF